MNDEGSWHGTRSWTPSDATASLPLVRRISDDLRAAYRRWRQAVEAFEYATAGSSVTSPSREAERLMADAQGLATEVESLQHELARLDIRVAQLEHGVLAFRSVRAGEIASLYWWPGAVAPSYDWPDDVPSNATVTSWPSRAHEVEEKRSRA
jgi:hypothetical protein